MYKDKIGDITREERTQGRKQFMRKYGGVYGEDVGIVNVDLLEAALFFAQNILNDINETCEGDEYIKKNYIIPRY